MRIFKPKSWWAARARREPDVEIGAGVPNVQPEVTAALERCMSVLRWHLGAYQRKDEFMMRAALQDGEAALGRRENLISPEVAQLDQLLTRAGLKVEIHPEEITAPPCHACKEDKHEACGGPESGCGCAARGHQ